MYIHTHTCTHTQVHTHTPSTHTHTTYTHTYIARSLTHIYASNRAPNILIVNTGLNNSINKQLQNRDRKANENILSVLNTQQTTSKIYQIGNKKIGCLSIAMGLQTP